MGILGALVVSRYDIMGALLDDFTPTPCRYILIALTSATDHCSGFPTREYYLQG